MDLNVVGAANVIGAILGWMPVVGLTELVKKIRGWKGWKAVVASILMSGAASALYLAALKTFTWPWFIIVWIAVTAEANGLFKAFHKPTANDTVE